ncbi:uncharacterized protein LY89DRAFT_182767 [Mollisia scopiformis]|uniref:HD domain-containing protein n=1 Tax=Mollisia scopiformis TaxID=149040 RepID=A0A194XUR4_MOLSC|nr:uncharacterized protein LY89DRAFT_182767 [Mollisia scopiformis]KUJ23447.1 hypothetical protein LY89DRAFT_182767 [Mollisia scopiformis]
MPSIVPTKLLAGVTVPDTPLIDKALAFARAHCDEFTYNHVVRSWLFGQYIGDHIPEFKERDIEVQAIAAILHDLGWATSGDLVSKDRRFEVDSAEGTRAFLIREGQKEDWDAHRIQLAWDAVALHTTHSIALYKQLEVKLCSMGIFADFLGPERSPGGVLTREVWNGIIAEFPRLGFRGEIKRILCGLCSTKPATTYDNFVAEFGVAYVEGYSLEGKRFVDVTAVAED